MQRKRIQITVVICCLLLTSAFDVSEAAKTSSSKSKSKSSSSNSNTSRRTQTNPQSHANPASFSYGGVAPNAPQAVRPAQQPSYVAQNRNPVYNAPPPAPQNYPGQQANKPIGWNVPNNNQNRPAYPANNQQPQYSQYPNQAPQSNFNQPPPAYRPPQPAYNPQAAPQPAYHPQPAPGYHPQQQPAGYHPQQQPAYNPPQQAYNPPPQIINNYHGVSPGMTGGFPQGGGGYQQQSSGPGLIKTAVVAGAAGLGGAALYNAFKNDDPKTTVVLVDKTQPAAAAEGVQQAAAPVAAAPVAAAPVAADNSQTYPQQQYPQQYPPQQQQYPNQQYPQQQPYDPNQPYDPALYNQQQPQQYDPNNPGAVSAPLAQPVENLNAPVQAAPTEAGASPAVPFVDPAGIITTLSGVPSESPLESSSIAPVAGDESTTASPTTILVNSSVPIDALSSRTGEVIEQKSATIVDQAPLQANTSTTENAAGYLKYSLTVLSLSLLYQFVIKSVL